MVAWTFFGVVRVGLEVSALAASQDKWAAAALAAERLPPAAFPGLPGRVAAQLVERGCTIPQVYEMSSPHNVISGEFFTRGETSWAVLCSVDGFSSLLLFSGDDLCLLQEIHRSPDRNWISGQGGEILGFSRWIHALSRDWIRARYQQAEGWPIALAAITHDGFSDALEGKDAATLYFTGVEWIWLPTAE